MITLFIEKKIILFYVITINVFISVDAIFVQKVAINYSRQIYYRYIWKLIQQVFIQMRSACGNVFKKNKYRLSTEFWEFGYFL